MHGTATKLQNLRKIKIEGAVEGEVDFDGSQNVTIATTQANIAILEGDLPNDGINTEIIVGYPKGFSRDNCAVISKSGIRAPSQEGRIYTTGTTFDSASYARGGVTISADLNSSGIRITAKNIQINEGTSGLNGITRALGSETKFGYRVILMKIL